MQVTVTFRKTPSSAPLKQHATEKIESLRKYLQDDDAQATMSLSVQKNDHLAEVSIHAHGLHIRGQEKTDDMYASIDGAIAKIEKQLKRYKEKMWENRPKSDDRLRLRYRNFETESEAKKPVPAKIADSHEITVQPMGLDEAVMQMDLLTDDILVFRDIKTNRTCVLYRRDKNKYSLIETQE